MSKELIVSSTPHETKVAILEDDQVVEVYFEREHEYSLAGSIYKGRVTRVLPGMQSAFVNVGLDRDAFLYVSDFFEDVEEYDALVSTAEEKAAKLEQDGTPIPFRPVPLQIPAEIVATPAPESSGSEATAAEPGAAPASPQSSSSHPGSQQQRDQGG